MFDGFWHQRWDMEFKELNYHSIDLVEFCPDSISYLLLYFGMIEILKFFMSLDCSCNLLVVI